jgi:hypothetical protein
VQRTIYLGTATRYEVGLPGGSTLLVDQPTTEQPEIHDNSDSLYITWSPASTLVMED